MSNELSDVQQELVEQQEAIIEYAKNLEDTIANYQAVNEHFGQHFESIVPALVVAWDTAPTKELQDSICQTEIIQQVSTPTTVSIFYLLTFAKLKITVLKIFVSYKYDATGKQADMSEAAGALNDTFFIVGIEPFGIAAISAEARKSFDIDKNVPLI